jgi:HAD superfamily hydrolase (TIGR01509 family)
VSSKRRRRAVLWDVGGTLVDFAATLANSVRSRLAGCGIAHELLCDERIGSTFAKFIESERDWRSLDDELTACSAWAVRLLDGSERGTVQISEVGTRLGAYEGMYKPVDGIIELLTDLRARGVVQAVVSNWPPSLPRFLDHHGLTRFFEAIVYSAQDGIHKPDPRIFARAMFMLNVSPADVVFIGDNPEWDILPTRALGMRAIHFDPRETHPRCDAISVPELRVMLERLLEEAW